MDYARRIPRFVAWIIDVIIVIIAIGILNGIGIIDTFVVEEGTSVSTLDATIQGLIGLAYFFGLTTAFGATLGKMAMGMKVVDAEGNKPGPGLVFIREFIVGGLAPLPALALGMNAGGGISFLVILITVFWILIDDNRQGLHDKAAKTFVVRT